VFVTDFVRLTVDKVKPGEPHTAVENVGAFTVSSVTRIRW